MPFIQFCLCSFTSKTQLSASINCYMGQCCFGVFSESYITRMTLVRCYFVIFADVIAIQSLHAYSTCIAYIKLFEYIHVHCYYSYMYIVRKRAISSIIQISLERDQLNLRLWTIKGWHNMTKVHGFALRIAYTQFFTHLYVGCIYWDCFQICFHICFIKLCKLL